jgi:chromosome partitioning protein
MKTRFVAVANEKGGVGKTATTVNLGAALANLGKSVLIMDLDPQHNATNGLGVVTGNGTISTYDLIVNGRELDIAEVAVKTAWDGLDMIPGHGNLAGIQLELHKQDGRITRLREAMDGLVLDYDFVLIDTPPSLSLLSLNALACANEVLIPCQAQPYAYKALEELCDTIAILKQDINPDMDITGIVLTFFDRRTRISEKIFQQLRNDVRYQDLLLNAVIRVNTTIAESAMEEQPLVFYKKNSNGARDYLALAEEFMLPVFFGEPGLIKEYEIVAPFDNEPAPGAGVICYD